MYKILLATDGSENSVKVVSEVLPIAEALNAEVTILNVVETQDYSYMVNAPFSDEIRDDINKKLQLEAEKIVEEAAKAFKEKGLTTKTNVVFGGQAPAAAICDIEKDDYNLIAVGSKGLRGAKEFFLGSVSNKVAHLGCKNVLIVK